MRLFEEHILENILTRSHAYLTSDIFLPIFALTLLSVWGLVQLLTPFLAKNQSIHFPPPSL